MPWRPGPKKPRITQGSPVTLENGEWVPDKNGVSHWVPDGAS